MSEILELCSSFIRMILARFAILLQAATALQFNGEYSKASDVFQVLQSRDKQNSILI